MEFVSEPITPEAGTFDIAMMGTGLAGLPTAFEWRGRRYAIAECLEHTKLSSPEGGSGERYLRRQEFRVLLDDGRQAVLYVERQSRPGSSPKRRWFLYAIASGGG